MEIHRSTTSWHGLTDEEIGIVEGKKGDS